MAVKVQNESAGREFLLWLWYESERNNGLFRLPDGKAVELWLGGRLALESAEGRTASDLTWRGDASEHDDARWALSSGRRIRRAEYLLHMDQQEWRFILDSDSLDLHSLKIPRPERDGEEHPQALALERLCLVEAVTRTVEKLFSQFLERRMSPEWEKTAEPGIRKWLSGARP